MDFGTLGVLYYCSEWLIRIAMLVIVPFRRTPEAAKGWLLLIFFLPWPGWILYHLIGRPTYPPWRRKRFKKIDEVFQPVLKRILPTLDALRPTLSPELTQAVKLVYSLGHLKSLSANDAELLADYDGAIDRLVADIDQAQNHVHLLYYIFADDPTGGKVLAALQRATERGVACRVLFDFLGSKAWSKSLLTKFKVAGVTVHQVLPVHLLRRTSARADLRNHRKIAVIDGRIGYTGSQNLVDSTFKPGITYDELVVRVTGPVVLQLQAIFVIDWYMESEVMLDTPEVFPFPVGTGKVAAQVLPSGPDYRTTNAQRFIVALLHNARQRIVITTPYFIPDEALVQALETAALRGLEVHLIVSRLADQLLVSLAQKSYYAELLESGVKIHLYRERFLHAKHLSIDDGVALIGSSNMDIRSFVLNAEVSLVFYDRDVTARLIAEQERYFATSDLLTAEEWKKRSLGVKVCENLARLMSPLL
jgi:cardiolipin synthase